MTQSVSIDELQEHLSDYLERAEAGEVVTVTRDGEVVAHLVPRVRPGPSNERYQEMIQQGVIRPGRHDLPEDFWDEPLVNDPEDLVLKALLEERESGW